MIFSSVFFIFMFLPMTLLAYFLVPQAFKNVVILIASLIFYAWGEPVYILLMIFSIVYNYVCGLEMDYYKKRGNQKGGEAGLYYVGSSEPWNSWIFQILWVPA